MRRRARVEGAPVNRGASRILRAVGRSSRAGPGLFAPDHGVIVAIRRSQSMVFVGDWSGILAHGAGGGRILQRSVAGGWRVL
jgi:hypothetical protein